MNKDFDTTTDLGQVVHNVVQSMPNLSLPSKTPNAKNDHQANTDGKGPEDASSETVGQAAQSTPVLSTIPEADVEQNASNPPAAAISNTDPQLSEQQQ